MVCLILQVMETIIEEEDHLHKSDYLVDDDGSNEESGGPETDGDENGTECVKSILELTYDDVMGLEFDSEKEAVKFYERYE